MSTFYTWIDENGHLDCEMTITVTEFKARCLEILRQVEETGTSVTIVRHKKTVAVIYPAASQDSYAKPWERLRGTATLHASPEESVISMDDFEAWQE
jgi:prevent-host-death family protein